MGEVVVVPAAIREAMVAHARAARPEEACGLLAGDAEGRLVFCYPTTNILRSATNYTIDPTEHFRALRHAESRGWELVGAFHSHPHTEPFPSPTDVELAAEPDWIYVIVGLADPDRPVVRGFRIVDGEVTEVALRGER